MHENSGWRQSRRWAGLLLFFLGSCLMSGCWDAGDVDLMSFPLATGYDLHIPLEEERPSQEALGDMAPPCVEVTSLIPNLMPDVEPKERIETVAASTVAYTREIREYGDDSVYFPGTLQAIVIGRNMAEQGIRRQLDSLNRLNMMSSGIFVCLAEGRAEEILRTEVESNRNIAYYLKEMFRDLHERMYLTPATLFEFVTNLGEGKNPVLPLVGVRDGKVEVVGCGVFEKEKLLATLNMRDSRKLTLLRGRSCVGYLPYRLPGEGEAFDAGTLRLRNERTVQTEKDEKGWHFTVQVFLDGSIIERENVFRVKDYTNESLREIEEAVETEMNRELTDFVRWMQRELGTDCIDLCRFALAKERKALRGIIDTPEFLRQADIRVETHVRLRNWGEKE